MRLSRTRVTAKTACYLGLFAAAVLLSGCGPKPTGIVKGTVKYNGKALKGGYVSFVSMDNGRSTSTGIGEDGTYTANGVPGGTCKVCVDTTSLLPQSAPGYPGARTGPPAGAKDTGPPPEVERPAGFSSPASAALARNKQRYVQIPDTYGKPESTPLTIEVSGGEQTYDIELK